MGIEPTKFLKGNSTKIKKLPNPSPDSLARDITPVSNGITLLWIDESGSEFDDAAKKYALSYLRQLSLASIRLYSSTNSCLKFIKSTTHTENDQLLRVFAIILDPFPLQFLSDLMSFSTVEYTIIYSSDELKYISVTENYPGRIIDVCKTIDNVYDCIAEKIQEYDNLALVFHFFEQKQNTTRNLTTDAASFIWFQLFQFIIHDLKCTSHDMELMLSYCEKQLFKNTRPPKVLQRIVEFRHTYQSGDAIHWYTKDSFIYRLLNKSLRTEDIEALYIFRFFIADLCRQLKDEHRKFSRQQSQTPIITVYRGTRMSCDELKTLKETIGNLTSLNGFISTSMKESVGINFLKKQQTRKENLEKVLFVIEVDTRLERIICAPIGNFSAFQEEDEVLFSIGTVFHLDKIVFDSDLNIWKVYMTATEDGIEAAQVYIDLIRQELTDNSISIIFGQLFLQMGKYLLAQKYFLDLLEQSQENDLDFYRIRYHLALTYGYENEFIQAEILLKQVYEHYKTHQMNNIELARIENALGWLYQRNGELDDAMIHYEAAFNFADDQLNLNHLINAQTCSLLADCHLEKFELDQAEKFYRKALEIEHNQLPSEHPRIGVTLNDLGNVYRKRFQMNEALKYYEQAESIFRRSLPKHHPYTAFCWSCMGFVYLYEENIQEAEKYHKEALETYRHVLPADHINIRISEKNLECTDYRKINDTYIKIGAQV